MESEKPVNCWRTIFRDSKSAKHTQSIQNNWGFDCVNLTYEQGRVPGTLPDVTIKGKFLIIETLDPLYERANDFY
jgi:hypothetical protein